VDFRTLKLRLARRRGFDGNPDRLGQFINDAVQEICGARPQWSWLLRHHQLETKPPMTTGAASTGDVATVTAGGHAVEDVALATTDYTLTGNLIALPDDNCYRISSVRRTTKKGGKLAIYTEQPYRGASSATATWKLYYDEYPLPPGTASVTSVVATGNGWTYPVRQTPARHQAVHSLATRDAEASPLTYSVMTHSQIPRIPDAQWKSKDPGTLHGVPLSGAGAASALPEGVYYYWVANRVHHTNEIGPLSGPIKVNKGQDPIQLKNLPGMHDYGLRVFRSVRAGEIGSKESLDVPPPRFLTDIDPSPGFPPVILGSYVDETTDDVLGHHQTSAMYLAPHSRSHGNHRIRFWPPTDKHYLVDVQYYIQHPDLIMDDDVTLVPAQYSSIILDFAEALALGEEENFSAAQAKRSNGMQKLDAAAMAEDVDPGTTLIVGGGDSLAGARELGGRWPKHVS
tara:strand:+ start:10682 stop:12049 length:1368 start_codon:yes stop_codon:yes gene_type:complete